MMRAKLAISAALLALTASAASAQVIPGGSAMPSPQGPFIGAQPFNPGFIQSPSFVNNGFTGFGTNGFTPGFATGANPGFNSGFVGTTNAGVPNFAPADPRLTSPAFFDTRIPGFAGVDALGNPVFFNTAANAVPTTLGTGTTGFAGFDQFGNPVFGNQFGFGNGFGNQFGFAPGFAAAPFGTGFYGGPFGGYGGVTPLTNQGVAPGYDPATGVRANSLLGRGAPAAIAGVNSPPLTPATFRPAPPGARYLVKMDPKTPEDMDRAARIRVEEDVAGTREEFRGGSNVELGTALENGNGKVTATEPEIKRSPATRDQVMLSEKLDTLMAQRPMREGLVTRIDKGNVNVQYNCRGENRTETFPAGEVFFFRTSGAIATAAMAPGALKVGDHVLVACNEDTPRQAVAGSRQELRSDHSDHNTPAAGSKATRSGKSAGRARSTRKR